MRALGCVDAERRQQTLPPPAEARWICRGFGANAPP
jgi:hypothetical protein